MLAVNLKAYTIKSVYRIERRKVYVRMRKPFSINKTSKSTDVLTKIKISHFFDAVINLTATNAVKQNSIS